MTPSSVVRLALLVAALGLASVGPGWAHGGNTTSNTHGETHHVPFFRVDLPEEREDEFLTRLTARIAGGPVLFDQSFEVPFGDAAVQAAVQDAAATLILAGLPDVLTLTGPTLLTSLVELLGSTTEQVGEALEGTTFTVTTTTTFGPATILIGEDSCCVHFVPAGSTHVNTNTHFQSFFNDLFQTTDTFLTREHYELVAFVQGVPAPGAGLLVAAGLAGLGGVAWFRGRPRARRGQGPVKVVETSS